jgi:hypothetical protein
MTWIRIFGHIHPHQTKKVDTLRLRIVARTIPAEATIDIADVQLQPGGKITGWTLNSRDLGVVPVDGWQWRNGVPPVGDAGVIVVADTESASPVRLDIRGASGEARAGQYFYGLVTGSASVDGHAHTATQGAGIPPHLTARSDIDIPVTTGARGLLTAWVRGLAVTSDTSIDPPVDLDTGPVTIAHTTWEQVLSTHITWSPVTDTHTTWA